MIQNRFTEEFNLRFPMIMAPMFLVSNEAMTIAAIDAGIIGNFPTLNFRSEGELEAILDACNHRLETTEKGTYGVNLIVQKTNIFYEKHLKICVEKKVPFYITSLGNPKKVIETAHAYGAKVFCDVTNLVHARKCVSLGCDGFIAVGQGAGGHAGPYPLNILIPALKKEFPDLHVMGAGGMASGVSIAATLISKADGVSIGTRFIACNEATVSQEYKDAIVNSKMADIVLSEKISGTPCTIINTPYAKKIGYKQNWFEKLLAKNKTIRKYYKMLVQYKGFKNLEASVKPGSYKTLWVAGQSVDQINEIKPCREIIDDLELETIQALKDMNTILK